MSDHEEPRWDLLPGDPEAFFGLAEGYDLRDLKRSYNQLLRRYKPEKFPQEFQRIRAAYETLNDALRFELPSPASLPKPAPLEPRPPAPSKPTGSSYEPSYQAQPERVEPPAPGSVFLSPAEALRDKPPLEVYRELRDRESKSAEDFIALAFLADVVADPQEEARSFFDWLLEGLAAHAHDWDLTQLVREYLSASRPLAELVLLLRCTVAAVAPDRFQYVTERAWDRVLREGSFEDYEECVRICGLHLARAGGHWQSMFYAHILRKAIWSADDAFVGELRADIDDHFHALANWTQRDYETTSLLLDYRAQREAFIARGPACQRMDAAIRDWCLLPEAQADLSVIDCFYFVGQRGRRLLDEFPDPKVKLPELMLVWEEITSDVLDRQQETAPLDDADIARHTRDLMIRVNRRYHRTPNYYVGLILVLAGLGLALTTLIASVALLGRMCWKLFVQQGAVRSGLFDGCLASAALVGGLLLALIVLVVSRVKFRMRYELARGELIKLLRVVPLPIHELAPALIAREDEKFGTDNDRTIDDTELIARGLEQDVALAIFALAQLGLRAAASETVVEAEVI